MRSGESADKRLEWLQRRRQRRVSAENCQEYADERPERLQRRRQHELQLRTVESGFRINPVQSSDAILPKQLTHFSSDI